VQEYSGQVGDREGLEALNREISQLIQETQLADHLEEAEKLEFKGQRKKALDRYYEALYQLRHDSIPDGRQNESIARVEAKIRELGGEIR
jgi:cobalamin biosynthesis Mg chelatase CobN